MSITFPMIFLTFQLFEASSSTRFPTILCFFVRLHRYIPIFCHLLWSYRVEVHPLVCIVWDVQVRQSFDSPRVHLTICAIPTGCKPSTSATFQAPWCELCHKRLDCTFPPSLGTQFDVKWDDYHYRVMHRCWQWCLLSAVEYSESWTWHYPLWKMVCHFLIFCLLITPSRDTSHNSQQIAASVSFLWSNKVLSNAQDNQTNLLSAAPCFLYCCSCYMCCETFKLDSCCQITLLFLSSFHSLAFVALSKMKNSES